MCWLFWVSIGKIKEDQNKVEIKKKISVFFKDKNTEIKKMKNNIFNLNSEQFDFECIETIENITHLLNLYKKYNLNTDKLIKDYTEDDYNLDIFGKHKDICLCPVRDGTLGDDELTLKIQRYVGDFLFVRLDNKIHFQYGIAPICKDSIYIDDLNDNSIFHLLIKEYVIDKGFILDIDAW